MKYLPITALLGGTALAALDVDVKDATSVKAAAKLVAGNLLSYYHGTEKGETTGLLPGPPPAGDYYWWEAGVMWDTLITYWDHTGDDQYNDLITQALLWQTGPNNDYLPPNQTASIGNDDQGYWAMAAMTAAENGLSSNGAGKGQEWLELVKNVFASQADRWDEKTCGGGLRWQIGSFNAGYDYKNSASTGVLFNIASRLAKQTGNSTYADWADKTWEWMESVGLMDKEYNIFDGAHTGNNCSDINKIQVSSNAGIFLQGAASMYNHTNGADVWKTRVDGLLKQTVAVFLDKSGVPVEIACESHKTCNTDMLAYKGIFLRGLASTAELTPYTLSPTLEAAATAAAKVCDEKTGECGFVWTEAKDDGSHGVGQQLNALSAFSVLLVGQAVAGSTNGTGTGASTTGGSGTGASTTTSGTPSGTTAPVTKPTNGAAVNGAGVGSLLGGLLLVAAFFA